MNFEILQRSLDKSLSEKVDALVVLWPEQGLGGHHPVAHRVSTARKHQHFEDQPGQVLVSYGTEGVHAPLLVVVHVGQGQPAQCRRAAEAAWAQIKGFKPRTLGVMVPDSLQGEGLQAWAMALAESSYSYVTTLSKPASRTLSRVKFLIAQPVTRLKPVLVQAQALVAGVELAKEWANRPPNHATPTHLADAARALAKGGSVQCEILGPREVSRLGMGAFMAVAQGSAQPLRFIVLRYNGAAKSKAPVVLVGKGITFDTGGISLKPGAEMDEMKFDMSGAASVLGVFRCLAELRPAINVVGLIPATENMPDGLAVKPGDVVTSMSGQTIEILNTDAEGRLILCDALTYAERFKPRAVIDIATLTGACVIALGAVRSGLFASDDTLAQALQQAGEDSGDLCWRMPLDDAYAEGLKSRFADVANIAGRAAGSVTAAKFLQRFAAKYPWAHLDIAGTAWKSGAAKGATGRPVPLLLHYLLGQS
jgi:leucyl aminopeptidase